MGTGMWLCNEDANPIHPCDTIGYWNWSAIYREFISLSERRGQPGV